ncbi:MAG: hypothetical protein PWQ08_592 [Clostridiales bacterium]|jgi:hypothetical protein|nr:hypothetical protein [Clostridiales bacterium]
MQIIGTVLLCLLGLFVALLLLLLFLPVWVMVGLRYDQLTIRVRVLFLTFTVFPMKEKPQKEKKPAPKKEPQKEEPRSPGKRFELSFSKLVQLVGDAAGIFKMMLGALKVRDISITLPLNGRDAADTALFYGKFSAWFYSGIAVLQNAIDLQFDSIELIPDFAGENKYRRSFYCKIGATPFIMLVIAIKALRMLQKDGLLPGFGSMAKQRGGTKNKKGKPQAGQAEAGQPSEGGNKDE